MPPRIVQSSDRVAMRGGERDVLARAELVQHHKVLVERVEVRGRYLDFEDHPPHLRCVSLHRAPEVLHH